MLVSSSVVCKPSFIISMRAVVWLNVSARLMALFSPYKLRKAPASRVTAFVREPTPLPLEMDAERNFSMALLALLVFLLALFSPELYLFSTGVN